MSCTRRCTSSWCSQAEPRIAELLHDKHKLGEWMATVPEPEPLELGAEVKGKK